MSALSKKITTALVGISVTAAIAGCAATETDSSSPPPPSNTTGAGPSGSPSGSTTSGGPYKDGKYTMDGEYGTRGSSIGVSVTLEDDEITTVDVTPHATDETSLGLQRRFADAVPTLVVGKDIDDVDLDRVAGNSHTPAGFNDALEKIKAEASS
ncbi:MULTISPECIES: hypothetical protein [Streptomyces]|uniref:FMN-binding domain-containing protein n=1 Tax=Streptomyces lonegramiae TaxID=3075524 RepID=A0ABU2XVR1_9ACTN|nr:hypothetical protein [Streptomyces sp. DSM 41529]MDT0550008.1 hypothetical protein [Streptomyces sp. DSM 41529]